MANGPERQMPIDFIKLADSLNKTRVFFTQILGLNIHESLLVARVFEASFKRSHDVYVTIQDMNVILDQIMPTEAECEANRNGQKAENVVEFRRPK